MSELTELEKMQQEVANLDAKIEQAKQLRMLKDQQLERQKRLAEIQKAIEEVDNELDGGSSSAANTVQYELSEINYSTERELKDRVRKHALVQLEVRGAQINPRIQNHLENYVYWMVKHIEAAKSNPDKGVGAKAPFQAEYEAATLAEISLSIVPFTKVRFREF